MTPGRGASAPSGAASVAASPRGAPPAPMSPGGPVATVLPSYPAVYPSLGTAPSWPQQQQQQQQAAYGYGGYPSSYPAAYAPSPYGTLPSPLPGAGATFGASGSGGGGYGYGGLGAGAPLPGPFGVMLPSIPPARARLRDWLLSIGLSEYYPSFLRAGYDDIDFLCASGGMTDADCDALGVGLAGESSKQRCALLFTLLCTALMLTACCCSFVCMYICV